MPTCKISSATSSNGCFLQYCHLNCPPPHLRRVLRAQLVLQLQRLRLNAGTVLAQRPALTHAAHKRQRLLQAHAA
jgi:hypothetical protein